MIKSSFQTKDVVKCRCVWQPPTLGSIVSLHLGSKQAARILCPEPQSPQMLDPDRSRKDITGSSTQLSRRNEENAPSKHAIR